ncbi:MAG: hypothetical protein A2Z77_05630 [Chloroflexi bacterium RBG_13_51_36]|nr:MAG: hypothetical protein A2Z77_05630 [Chloroflexi bacterium RBG_13_51_36]
MDTTALSVIQAVAPLLIILVIFQVLFLKLPRSYVLNLLKGTIISAFGLLLFLQGVHAGFLPYGQAIGEALGNFTHKWLVIPFGFLLGFITTWSEPAVRILCDQVEEASAGSIHKWSVLYAICIGVAFFVALGMARVVYSIPLLLILLPGYAFAIVILWFTQREFVGIAFDAGGVATGPMANTFLLGIGLGLSSAAGDQNMIIYGLGLVALIALAPIISVMALGLIIRIRIRYRG